MSTRLVVADDLTGATDAAVEFADRGWRAVLHRGGPLSHPVDPTGVGDRDTVVATSTGVRGLSDDLAARVTAAAVGERIGSADRLLVKIDSTVRGSVAGQIAGGLAGWRERHPGARAVVCPASPAHGRTVRSGAVLVEGVPVEQSPAGQDPVSPVREGDLTRLVPGAVGVPVDELGRRTDPILVVDAEDDADLDRLAAALEPLGPEVVAVGSAGLAAALARRGTAAPSVETVPAPGDVLVVVSSLHPVAQEQLRVLTETLDRRGDRARVRVLSTSPERGDASRVAAELAERVRAELRRRPVGTVVLVGGDGAAAVLDALGAHSLQLHHSVLPGTPVGTVVGGDAAGLRVVTKSGGFGNARSLVAIIDRVMPGPTPQEES